MGTRKRIRLREKDVVLQWRTSAGHTLSTVEGECLTVVYPGLCPGGGGPDFRDAVMLLNGRKVVLGDVEVHGCTADWSSHGHGDDPAYRNVVLHVVGEGNGESRTPLDDGRTVPIVVVGVPGGESAGGSLPCTGGESVRGVAALSVLRGAGMERLRERALRLESEVRERGWESVLCRCIGRTLGYSSNAGAFEELVRRVCVPSVRDMLLECSEEERRACIVGAAGLLPRSRRNAGLQVCGDAPEWEAVWRERMSGVEPMPASSWMLRGIYPNNFPVRRLVAFADLLPILAVMGHFVDDTVRRSSSGTWMPAEDIEDLFTVHGNGYWRSHYDFGCVTRESDVLGTAKARNLVVNAVVPCAYALASVQANMEVRRAVITFFSTYPVAGMHAVARHMCCQLGIGRRDLTAVIEQGLMHVYLRYCREGLCFVCPLGEGPGCGSG